MNRCKIIADALENGLNRSVGFFGALTPEQLDREIYQDGARWTALQVVAHFVTIERSMHWLFDDILSGGQGSPVDFDVDRFNQSQTAKLNGLTLEDLMAQFIRVRRKTINMVKSMSEKDLDRKGHHAFHGEGKLERFIRWAYEHARMHEDDIQKVLNESPKT